MLDSSSTRAERIRVGNKLDEMGTQICVAADGQESILDPGYGEFIGIVGASVRVMTLDDGIDDGVNAGCDSASHQNRDVQLTFFLMWESQSLSRPSLWKDAMGSKR